MTLASPVQIDAEDAETAAENERVALARRGSREALTALAVDLLPRVRNLVRYLVRGDAEVDDIAQEALVAVLRGLPSYCGLGVFCSWADRVVARSTFAYLKRERHRVRLNDTQCDFESLADTEALPDEYLSRRRLVQAMDQLPLEQRYALVLHHVLGLSVTEIAEEAGAPIETIRTRLRLGRSKLRLALDNQPYPAEAPDDEC